MAELLVQKHDPEADGNILRVTPESAHWSHVGFEVYRLRAGESLRRETGDREVCITLLGGRANVATEHERCNDIGERMNVFDGRPPFAVYVPSGDQFRVEAVTDLELAVSSAPGKGSFSVRLIRPDDVGVEDRGTGSNSRRVHNILPENQPADSLLVVEVYTPEGNWSSYPPHKHDTDNPPAEVKLEETYYYRYREPEAYGIQRLYTADGRFDEVMRVVDGDLALIPEGYHPFVTAYGYDAYYLNVLAGDRRSMAASDDPQYVRFRRDWPSRDPRLPLLERPAEKGALEPK